MQARKIQERKSNKMRVEKLYADSCRQTTMNGRREEKKKRTNDKLNNESQRDKKRVSSNVHGAHCAFVMYEMRLPHCTIASSAERGRDGGASERESDTTNSMKYKSKINPFSRYMKHYRTYVWLYLYVHSFICKWRATNSDGRSPLGCVCYTYRIGICMGLGVESLQWFAALLGHLGKMKWWAATISSTTPVGCKAVNVEQLRFTCILHPLVNWLTLAI